MVPKIVQLHYRLGTATDTTHTIVISWVPIFGYSHRMDDGIDIAAVGLKL